MHVRRGAFAVLLVSAAVSACTGVSTDPQVPLALQFDSLPALAIVVGDTMRGDNLLPARLPVRAFDGNGTAMNDTVLRVIGIDSASAAAFTRISDLRLVARRESPTVRIVGQAGALQSQTLTFAVVPRPTGMVRTTAATDSLVYNRADTSQRFVDVGVNVVRQAAPESTVVALNGLRVRMRLVSFTDSILDSVRIVNTAGRSDVSSLVAGGAAKLTLKAYPKATARGRGTVTIEASHRALGVEIPGSPLRVTIPLVPATVVR